MEQIMCLQDGLRLERHQLFRMNSMLPPRKLATSDDFGSLLGAEQPNFPARSTMQEAGRPERRVDV